MKRLVQGLALGVAVNLAVLAPALLIDGDSNRLTYVIMVLGVFVGIWAHDRTRDR